ncbi:MAG: carboxypeptidase-like regulatory domain-containing protein [Myxococcota bacterium]
MTLLMLSVGCGSTERIEGKVVDVWGNPISGATVMVVGGSERPMTDANGRYAIARADGRMEMKAGCKGYIQEHRELVVEPGDRQPQGPLFELYPKPEAAGFYVVGTGRYAELEAQPVKFVGNALQQFRGIADHGEVTVESGRPRIVFHTDLREDEILRLGLELHQLKYAAQETIPGPVGTAEITVNLWVDGGKRGVDLVPLRSKTDYLLTPTEVLEPGTYVLETQGLLSGSPEAFAQIPEELRLVFPFEVR